MNGEYVTVPADTWAAINEDHHWVPKLICDARTKHEVVVTHQFSDNERPVILRCTEPFQHKGDHSDGSCCWRSHSWSDRTLPSKNVGKSRDQGCCSCRRSPCKTQIALAEASTISADEGPMSVLDLAEQLRGAARGVLAVSSEGDKETNLSFKVLTDMAATLEIFGER